MKSILSIDRRFPKKPVDIHELPEHGFWAPWRTDRDRHELLKDKLKGHRVSYWPQPLWRDSALGELALKLYPFGNRCLTAASPMLPDEDHNSPDCASPESPQAHRRRIGPC